MTLLNNKTSRSVKIILDKIKFKKNITIKMNNFTIKLLIDTYVYQLHKFAIQYAKHLMRPSE